MNKVIINVLSGQRRVVPLTQQEIDEINAIRPAVPRGVSMCRFHIALSRAGLLARAKAAVAAQPGQAGEEARIRWSLADSISIKDPLVAEIAAALKLTPDEVGDLFVAAAGV